MAIAIVRRMKPNRGQVFIRRVLIAGLAVVSFLSLAPAIGEEFFGDSPSRRDRPVARSQDAVDVLRADIKV
jgi:hypothetical protein